MSDEENNDIDPRLRQPGELGRPAIYDDSVTNLPGSQADPLMPDSKIDPDAPISSAKGATEA